MTPKEKAEQLVKKYLPNFIEKYNNHGFDDYDFNEDRAKQCAFIAVEFAREFITGDLNEKFDKFIYLQDIKEEIEKL